MEFNNRDILAELKILNMRISECRDLLKGLNIDNILTEKQVLDMLGIGAKTLRSYRTNGLLAYSKIGNRFFYWQSDIDKMLNNARIESDNNSDGYG